MHHARTESNRGQQDFLAKSWWSNRARPLHVHHPQAIFTLVKLPAPTNADPNIEASEVAEEFHLGAFELPANPASLSHTTSSPQEPMRPDH